MVLPTAIALTKNVLSLVVRPVGDTCNLRCSYCYLGAAVDTPLSLMSESCLGQLTREASETANRIEFLWHGGEPLLAGISFFKSAIRCQRATSARFQNFIQTNGTLIDREWADFFAEHDFHVRLSLDGPQVVHDRFRTYKSARKTHSEVIKAVETLRASQVEPLVSCVITEDSVPMIDEIYRSLRDLGISQISCLPAFVQIAGKVVPPTLSPDGYVLAYGRLFDIWSEDTERISIRELEGIVSSMLGRPAGDCTFTGVCSQVARVEPDGRMYPCELHKGELGDCYGQIGEQHLSQIMTKRHSSKVGTLCKTLVQDECRACQWYKLCHGGCYAAYVARADGNKFYYYCEARKQLFAHIQEKLLELPLLIHRTRHIKNIGAPSASSV